MKGNVKRRSKRIRGTVSVACGHFMNWPRRRPSGFIEIRELILAACPACHLAWRNTRAELTRSSLGQALRVARERSGRPLCHGRTNRRREPGKWRAAAARYEQGQERSQGALGL